MTKLTPKTTSRRIIELDLLRGFFIIVIILDHLQFWPSPWQYMTGQGRLWVSAAEGFFIISGFLIGYLRAYKGFSTPLKDLSKKLLSRAGVLWVWCIIITFVVVSFTILMPEGQALQPKLPRSEQVTSLPTYILNVTSGNYASDWIYFLRLYAIVLAATPVFLWLIRKGRWYVALGLSVIAFATVSLGWLSEPALQWQLLFFGAALIGWKFESILAWFNQKLKIRQLFTWGIIAATLITMVVGYFMVHGWSYVESPTTSITRESYVSVRAYIDPLFSNNPMSLPRVALSFVWFGGLLMIFHLARRFIQKYLGWLLYELGQNSLTAYCLHALLLPAVVTYVKGDGNFWLNGLIGVFVVLLIWGIMKIPITKKILPR